MDPPGAVSRAPYLAFSADERQRLTYINAAVRALLGYEASESLGTPLLHYVHPDDRAKLEGLWRELAAGREAAGAELRLRRADGRVVLLVMDLLPRTDGSGRFEGVDGMAFEAGAGDRAQLERALHADARFRDIVERLPCVVYVAEAGWPPRLLYISGNVQDFIGYSPEEFCTDPTLVFRCMHPDDRERVAAAVREATNEPEPYTAEYRIIHRNGRDVVHISARSTPLLDSAGRVVLRHGIIVDLTEQRRLEQELLQSQRLAAIGEMATMMAHEIRNPVAGASLALRMLRSPTTSPTTAQGCLDDLDHCLERIDATVSRVLDFSKARPLTPRRCRLPEILAAAERLTAAFVRRSDIQVRTHLAPDVPELTADPDQLEQLFVNLILNACKAMPEGGEITIRVALADGRVVAEVSDSGIGIRPEHLDHIFDPFYSGFGDGTGLGLPLCRRIVSAHGGRIDVDSAPGAGSTFRIELPLEPS